MATAQELAQDPEFLALDDISKRQVLEASDPDFASLDDQSKTGVVSSLKGRQLKPSTQETLKEEQAQREQIIKEAQSPLTEKVLPMVKGIPGMIEESISRLAKGGVAIGKEMVAPSDIQIPGTTLSIPGVPGQIHPMNFLEAGRRGLILASQIGSQMLPRTPQELAGMAAGPVASTALSLIPKRLTEEEIQAEIANRISQQGLQEEREKGTLPGASPEIAEGILEAAQHECESTREFWLQSVRARDAW